MDKQGNIAVGATTSDISGTDISLNGNSVIMPNGKVTLSTGSTGTLRDGKIIVPKNATVTFARPVNNSEGTWSETTVNTIKTNDEMIIDTITGTAQIPSGSTVTPLGGTAYTLNSAAILLVNFEIKNTYTVTLPSGTGYTVTPETGSTSPVTAGGSYSFKVALGTNYEKGTNFAVKANDQALTADTNGVYTIANIQENQQITVSGLTSLTNISVDITWGEMPFIYQDTSNGTWNPQSLTYDYPTQSGWVPTADGANKITIQNNSLQSVTASFAYTQTITDVSGKIASDSAGTTAITAPVAIAEEGKKDVWVILAGKPSKELSAASLGTVTVTIGGN